MLLSELYKIMVNKVTFVVFRGMIAPIAHPPGSAPGSNRALVERVGRIVFIKLADELYGAP